MIQSYVIECRSGREYTPKDPIVQLKLAQPTGSGETFNQFHFDLSIDGAEELHRQLGDEIRKWYHRVKQP